MYAETVAREIMKRDRRSCFFASFASCLIHAEIETFCHIRTNQLVLHSVTLTRSFCSCCLRAGSSQLFFLCAAHLFFEKLEIGCID